MILLLLIVVFSANVAAIGFSEQLNGSESVSVGYPKLNGAFSKPPSVQWDKTIGGPYNEILSSIMQTSDGGYILVGVTTSFGAGLEDFWLVKTDSLGNLEWNQTYGGPDCDWALTLLQTSDGGYLLAGATRSFGAGSFDLWLVKTDSAGNLEWNKTYGGPDHDGAASVLQTSDGGYVLGAYTYSWGAGLEDLWLVKTDSAGNLEWNKTYGGPYCDWPMTILKTNDCGYAFAGSRMPGPSETHAHAEDFWLVKADSAGNFEWNKSYGGPCYDWTTTGLQTSDGGYVIVGYTNSSGVGSLDFCMVKTDSAGNLEWNKTYGGPEADGASSVLQTSDGGYLLAGATRSFGAGLEDFWLVKTDSQGNIQWDKTYGGPEADGARSVLQTSDGGYLLAGFTESYGAGKEDLWLIKLAPPTNGIVIPLDKLGLVATTIIVATVVLVVYIRHRKKLVAKPSP